MKRREILKATILGSGAAALGSIATEKNQAQQTSATNVDEQKSIDVLIVGAGNAGIPAAIEAADLGGKVMLIEKNDFVGGMLIISGGHISGANAKIQMRKEIKDSYEKHYQDAMRIGKFKADSELLALATEHAAPMIDWLEEIGVEFTDESPVLVDDHDHYSVPRTYIGKNLARSLLWPLQQELDKRIARGNLDIRLETTALNLLQDKNKKVIGLRVKNKAGDISDFFAKTVILTTGGYGANKSMQQEYNPKVVSAKWVGLPHATGDGIIMAKDIGAKLANMDHLISYPGTVFDLKGFPTSISTRLQFPPKHFTQSIWVNKKAERFVNEHTTPDNRETAFLKQEELFFYVVFDKNIREQPGTLDIRNWTREQMDQEINAGNIIVAADSLKKLAAKLGISSEGLKNTIREYNERIEKGKRDQYGRTKQRRIINKPPFFAFGVGGSVLNTHGGISVNSSLEVIDEDGMVIAGLYAAGEVLGNGHLMGEGVVSGMSVGPAITFGRLVARTAYRNAQCQCSDEAI